MVIEILNDDLINQIAAGEVIEAPFAVIKELIENSIDAGAKNIELELSNFGKKKIILKDDGCGITREDLLKAPIRHATSKIQSFNDLYSIKTMGFRGEALASIFSVAKTKIISKVKDNDAFEISSGNIRKVKLSSREGNGTTIIVEDIFYNTPARKKYLKSDNLELKAILDVFERFEVSYFDKSFVLKHDDKILSNKPIFKSMEENIYYVLGRELKGRLFEFDENIAGLRIFGFIGKPSELSYSFRKNQFIFVNGRYVRSKLIRDAIYDGFSSNLMIGKHPFFILNLDIDPEIIDVNIHPSKIEIKFENELEVYEFIRRTIENLFIKKDSFKAFEENLSLEKFEIEIDKRNEIKKDSKKTYFSKNFQNAFDIKENEIIYEKKDEDFDDDEEDDWEELKEKIKINKGPLWDVLNEYRILGQINKTYIAITAKNDFFLIDQHVAEEKYYYEKFIEDIESKKKSSQILLKSQLISLSKSEMIMYEENKKLLDDLGFVHEKYGKSEILVRAVPINIRREIVNALDIRDILHGVLINDKIKSLEEEKYSKIASMACRMSIMAGDELSIPQMKRIIENLKTLKQPFNCPHGRPTFLRYPYNDLDKKFKRV